MSATAHLPVLDPATMRVTGEVEVDASLAVPVPSEQPDEHAQRLPTPNDRPAIVDLVLARPLSPKARAVIAKRDEVGVRRYGTRLQAFNGRDVGRDMTDEAADAVNYAMQGIQEAPDDAARAKWERRFAMAEALLEEMVGEAVEPAAGPVILARAAAHNAITGEELPAVLEAIGEARNGPIDDDPPPLTPEKARELADEGARASAAYLKRTRGMEGAPSERDEIERSRARIRELEDHVEKANDERQALDELYDETLVKRDALSAEVARMTRERDEDMQRTGVLLDSRNAYRDRLRKLMCVTEPDGEQLIAMVERAMTGHMAEVERLEKQAEETRRIIKLRVTAIESDLGIKITDHEEPLADRLLRVRSVLLHGARGVRAQANTLKRWQARARKAEARVAVLTEERDGLTLRLGEKERKRVQRGARRKASTRKGGR